MIGRLLAAAALALPPMLAGAELEFAAADGVLIRHEFRIAAPAAKAWESLVHPERWWPEDHTWSGKRASLSLEPEAGGCYCERWDPGVVTVAEGEDVTTAVVTYRASGDAAHRLDSSAAAADQVLGLQFAGFAANAAE